MPPTTHPPLLAKHIAKKNLKWNILYRSDTQSQPHTRLIAGTPRVLVVITIVISIMIIVIIIIITMINIKIIIIIIIITSRGAMVWGEVGKWKAKPQRPRLVSYLQWTGALHHHHCHHYPQRTLYHHHYHQQHHHHYALLHCSWFMKLVKYHGEDQALYEGLCVLV